MKKICEALLEIRNKLARDELLKELEALHPVEVNYHFVGTLTES